MIDLTVWYVRYMCNSLDLIYLIYKINEYKITCYLTIYKLQEQKEMF